MIVSNQEALEANDRAAINTMRVRAFTELIDEQLNGMNLEEARTYLYELELVLRTKINAIDLSLNVSY